MAVVGNATWAHPNPTPQVSLIYVEDLEDLRAELNEALTTLHLETPPFTDPDLIGISESATNATPVKAIHIRELRERLKDTIGSSCYKSIEQFVKDFYQGVLQRPPSPSELSAATATLQSAQAQSASALITAAQNLGSTLFGSSEYTNLGTSDSQFITDLYVGFLQRQPDSAGHQWWLADLQGQHNPPSYTPRPRSDLITAFKTSGEFTENAKALCLTAGGGSTTGSVHWMIADQLGTPRMILDATGSLANMSRHDYLPFGEELPDTIGLRSGLSYTNGDGARQKFTQKERDIETGLDYFEARYYSNIQGRFTGIDPLMASAKTELPQTWNRYAYCLNNPLVVIDPTGLIWGRVTDKDGNQSGSAIWYKDEAAMTAANSTAFTPENNVYEDIDGALIYLNPTGPNANGETQGQRQGWWQVGRIREPGIDMMQNQPFDLAIGNAAGKLVTSIIGRISARFFGTVLGGAAETTTTGVTGATTKTVTNPVSSSLARVIPGEGPFSTLAPRGATDAFVTASEDIAGMSASQLAPRLGISSSKTFTVFEFKTPTEGLASPVFRNNPFFKGFGRTIGGAREFVIPNGPIPANATTKVVH